MKPLHIIVQVWNAEDAGTNIDFAHITITEELAKKLHKRHIDYEEAKNFDNDLSVCKYTAHGEAVFFPRKPELENDENVLAELLDKIDGVGWLEIEEEILLGYYADEEEESDIVDDFLDVATEGFWWVGVTDDGEVHTDVIPWRALDKFL